MLLSLHRAAACLTRYENDLKTPSAPRLAAVAKALDVTVEEILDDTPLPNDFEPKIHVHGNSRAAKVQEFELRRSVIPSLAKAPRQPDARPAPQAPGAKHRAPRASLQEGGPGTPVETLRRSRRAQSRGGAQIFTRQPERSARSASLPLSLSPRDSPTLPSRLPQIRGGQRSVAAKPSNPAEASFPTASGMQTQGLEPEGVRIGTPSGESHQYAPAQPRKMETWRVELQTSCLQSRRSTN
jgi:hypothetical protein